MPAIIKANLNTKGSGLVNGLSYDSQQITTISSPGKNLPRRLVQGLQNQATQALIVDNTAGVLGGNWIPGDQPSQGVISATITNIVVSTSAGVTTCVVTAANTFLAGQTVEFKGLTQVPTLNGLCGVVVAAALTSSAFTVTVVEDINVATQTTHSETGTATVNFSARSAMLSLQAEGK